MSRERGTRVVFFGNDTERNAAVRYRVLRFAEMLRDDGYDCRVCLPSSRRVSRQFHENRGRLSKLFYLLLVALRRIAQLRHVPGAGAVYLRGPVFPYGPPLFERVIRLLNRRLVFDIDDAMWAPPAYVDSPFVRFIDRDWVWKMCALCRHGVVGNDYLREKVAPHCARVTVIPTCVDMPNRPQKAYPPADKRPVVLGWTGLHTNLGYFEVLAEPLRALARRHDIVLYIASDQPFALPGVHVENHVWRLGEQLRYLTEPDIGLMPLVDSERARGKCAFKALEFMAVGTPCVVSPVGMNTEAVEDGVTGWLAATPREWEEKLERLITDAPLRERMGRAARERMMERYAHAANYPRFKAVIDETAEGD